MIGYPDADYNGIVDFPYSIPGNGSHFDPLPLSAPIGFPYVDHPSDLTYAIGSVGNFINWTLGSNSPSTYNITLDGNIYVEDTTWTNGTIKLQIDNLDLGPHTVTIFVTNTQGNTRIDTVQILVVRPDTAPPVVITSFSLISYKLRSSNNTIVWEIFDQNPKKYSVLFNDSKIIVDQPWTNGSIVVDIDGLAEGVYNYTILVSDMGGRISSNTVIVIVHEATSPDVSSPSDIVAEERTSSVSIQWTIGDINPGTYTVQLNSSVVMKDQPWQNGTIYIDISKLVANIYNYTIIVLDSWGNENIDTIFVTIVKDMTPPYIESPGDLVFEFGSKEMTISWKLNDSHPGTYRLLVDDLTQEEGPWTNGLLDFSVYDSSIGTYNYTISVSDQFGNTASDTVLVSIVEIASSQSSTSQTATTSIRSSSKDRLTLNVFFVPTFIIALVTCIIRRKRVYIL